MKDCALIIFIKNPELGKAKTRLAKTIGDEAALEAYKVLLAHTQQVSQEMEAARFLFYSRFIDEHDDWSNSAFQKKLQSTGDLGQKMQRAFKEVFEEGYKKAVIIGSDCGDLKAEHLEQAFNALDEKDIVIGPAKDGGYYLLGMKQLNAYLFQNKDWSTPKLLEQTLADVNQHRQSVQLLEELNDIDTQEDWEEWKARRNEEY